MKLTTLFHLKMGQVLATEGKLYQTKRCTCCRWCVKGNGARVGASNNGKRTNGDAVVLGSNNLPNRSAI
jgi:hypothetical protein